jgi:hypothetical protein
MGGTRRDGGAEKKEEEEKLKEEEEGVRRAGKWDGHVLGLLPVCGERREVMVTV